MKVPWDIRSVSIKVTKHFSRDYMRYWNWDFHDLRDAIQNAYKIDKCGKNKFEVYMNKSGYKKIITAYYDIENELVCITGSQGGNPK